MMSIEAQLQQLQRANSHLNGSAASPLGLTLPYSVERRTEPIKEFVHACNAYCTSGEHCDIGYAPSTLTDPMGWAPEMRRDYDIHLLRCRPTYEAKHYEGEPDPAEAWKYNQAYLMWWRAGDQAKIRAVPNVLEAENDPREWGCI